MLFNKYSPQLLGFRISRNFAALGLGADFIYIPQLNLFKEVHEETTKNMIKRFPKI